MIIKIMTPSQKFEKDYLFLEKILMNQFSMGDKP